MAPATVARPRARRRKSPAWRLLGRIVAASAVLVAGAAVVTLARSGTAAASLLTSRLDDFLGAAGFGLDEIVLTGHRNTPDTAIFDALDLEHARSLASINMNVVRRRLEELPWIAGAELTRVYPGRLEVRVRERKAFAVWRTRGREVLVDEAGRTLGEIHRSTGLGLPILTGAGAPAEASALMTALAGYPDVAARIETAERVGARRWTLHLAGNVELMLPADREAAALADLIADPRLGRLVEAGGSVIDLRVPGRVAVRPAGAGAGRAGAGT